MKLYYSELSPPARAVLLTTRALDIAIDLHHVDMCSREKRDENFVKLNPQHSIPILVDGEFVVWDGHAIVGYLVGQYADNDLLYPRDPKQRALVDQILHFDSGTLYPRVNSIMHSIVIENEKEISTDKISAITEAYRLLDTILQGKSFVTGDNLTVADFCCVSSVSTATIITPISTEKYPNLSTWYRTCKNLPYYEDANGIGLNKLDALVEIKLGRPRTKELCE